MSKTIGYGEHPTIYGGLSDTELYSMYRRETWLGLNENSRRELLQETVNRAASERGELGSCEVRFADLEPGVSGEQAGNVIRVNREMFAEDTIVMTSRYGTDVMEYTTSNVNALETVLHENEHAWQNQCIRGEIEGDPQLTREYRSNDFDVSAVQLSDGTVQAGSQYMTGETGYEFYYFQSTERDAYRFSQERTQEILNGLEQEYGTEPSFAEYREELMQTGFEAYSQEVNRNYGVESFEREVNTTLMNHYYGTHNQADPKIEEAVRQEMAESYEASKRSQQQSENKTFNGREYTPTTLEEYEAQLHGQVNDYYTHAVNDPTVSQEEAYAETTQMAENYLDAVAEYEEAAQQEAASMETDTGFEIDDGGMSEGGME